MFIIFFVLFNFLYFCSSKQEEQEVDSELASTEEEAAEISSENIEGQINNEEDQPELGEEPVDLADDTEDGFGNTNLEIEEANPELESKSVAYEEGSTEEVEQVEQVEQEGNLKTRLGYNVGNHLIVSADLANVREGPGETFKITEELKNTDKVIIRSRKGAWVQIGTNKWISQKFLTGYFRKYSLIEDADIYKNPSNSAELSDKIPKGSEVMVQSFHKAWAKVGSGRYILRKHIKLSN